MGQAVKLVADERRQDDQRNREHPAQPTQQAGDECQLDGAMHEQVGGGKMLRTGSQVLRHAHRVGGKEIIRVFGQFLARQPRDHTLDLGPGGHEQGEGPDQFEATVHALEDHARQKGAVCEAVGIYHAWWALAGIGDAQAAVDFVRA